VLAGTEHSHGATARPVPLVDVTRAAISEIERYERVHIQTMPDAPVAGRAADDVSHLIAELLDNATGFSEPSTPVHLSGWLLENGEVMLSVEDTGIGMPDERLNQFNELLADPDPEPPGAAAGMGLYVVARLAHRHGVRTQLRPQAGGGTTAVLVLPQLLLPPVDPNEPPATPIEAALAGSGLTGSRRAGHVPADEAWSASLSATGFVTPTGPETTGVPLAGAVPEPVGGPGSGMPPAGAPPIRVPAQAPPPGAVPPAHAVQHDRSAPETGAGGLTAMGLPRRVARGTGMGDMIVHEPRRRQGGPVDPAELRRKLGGLQRGTQAGRRDAAYEVSTGTGPMTGLPGAAPQEAAPAQTTPRHAAPGARQSAPEAHSTQGDAGPAENAEEATR
jgi:hypothetical protein